MVVGLRPRRVTAVADEGQKTSSEARMGLRDGAAGTQSGSGQEEGQAASPSLSVASSFTFRDWCRAYHGDITASI